MPNPDFPATVQRILLSGQQLIRVASMPDGILPSDDREFMLGHAVAVLRDAIGEFQSLSTPLTQEPAKEFDLETYRIPSEPSAFSRCLDILRGVLDGIRGRWNSDEATYWSKLEHIYEHYSFDDEGEPIGGRDEVDAIDWPDRPQLVVFREEMERLEVVLPHLELAAISLPSESELVAADLLSGTPKQTYLPIWDKESKLLTYKGHECVRFSNHAPRQFRLLDAFQEAGWPEQIPNPFRSNAEALKDALKYLRRLFAETDSPIAIDRCGGGVAWRVRAKY